MKQLVLLLLFTNYIYSQQSVEVRLVSSEIGTAGAITLENPNVNTSNDTGLNSILAAHNVFEYNMKIGHPYPGLTARIMRASCNCDANQLVADLEAYSSVVQSAKIYSPNSFPDALVAKLNTVDTGVPVGSENNVIVTNDPGLNQIFLDFNVYYFTQSTPGASDADALRYYNVACNCDKALLEEALLSYPEVIESTEDIPAQYLLGTPRYTKPEFVVYPNPFKGSFSIKSNQDIKSHLLFDISGKAVIRASSESELETACASLSPGVYLLKSETVDGLVFNTKLIKQ